MDEGAVSDALYSPLHQDLGGALHSRRIHLPHCRRLPLFADMLRREEQLMVGATGFEPATSCSRSRRATKLRYAPPTVSILESRCDCACSTLPSVLSHELDEHARGMLAGAHLA